jgi:hypothetical protein
MIHEDTEVIFPPRVIPGLRDLRGSEWIALVDNILTLPPLHVDRLAFVLMMVRLNGCATCHADSFRAMRGCTHCAVQNIRRLRGDDDELLKNFHEARQDVEAYLSNEKDKKNVF